MCASLRLPRLAVAVLAPDIKSSPDDNSLGGGVRSPAILQGKKVDIGNMRTGEKLEKLVLGQNRNDRNGFPDNAFIGVWPNNFC